MLYPDVLVTGEVIEWIDDRIREPRVILDVLGGPTADRDRGRKWVAYQQLPSLQQYVLIALDQRRMDVFSRANNSWTYEVFDASSEPVLLPVVDAELTFDQVYADSGI